MKILVTGGLGFVGVNVVRILAGKEGVHVIAADLPEKNRPEIEQFLAPVADFVHKVALDVTDRSMVKRIIQEEAVTHIVHGAAITPTREQEKALATRIVDVNLSGAVNVLDAGCRSSLVKCILLLSSSAITGAGQGEEPTRAGDNLYYITKGSVEQLAARYGHLFDRQIASLRLASVYGPLETPSDSRKQTTQIHQLMVALLSGRHVRVAGPSVRRDWVYAADVGEAIWLMLNAGNYVHAVYNVGSGTAVSFQQVVDAFVDHGLSCEWCDDADLADIAMRSEQGRTALDIQHLREAVNFMPTYDIVSGIAAYLDSA